MNLFSLAILTAFNLLFVSVADQSNEQTLILNPIMRLSSRRKRSLLFPNYGSIKITVGLAQGLIGNNPKGLSLSYEMCSYFAGPTVIEDLLNELKHEKPKLKDTEKPNITKNLMTLQDSTHQKYPNRSNAYFPISYTQSPFKEYYFDRLETVRHKSPRSKKFFERSSSIIESEPKLANINAQKKSLLKLALDYLLGPNVKCSILKLICHSKELLLPPGYSMVQDIVRIVTQVAALEKYQ